MDQAAESPPQHKRLAEGFTADYNLTPNITDSKSQSLDPQINDVLDQNVWSGLWRCFVFRGSLDKGRRGSVFKERKGTQY